jgi:hypothetical protein
MLFNTSCPQVLHVFFSKVLSCNLSTCFVDFVKTSNRTEYEASLPTEAQKQLENAQMETDLQRSRVADMKDGLQRKLIRFCRNAIK